MKNHALLRCRIAGLFLAFGVLLFTACDNIVGFTERAIDGLSPGGGGCNHIWGAWTMLIYATVDAKGIESRACQSCGGTQTSRISFGLAFDPVGYGQYALTSFGGDINGTQGAVYIPHSRNVTAIGDGVFLNRGLTSISIPSSVTSIGSGAFAENLLTSVAIPPSVTSIGNAAFAENLLTSVAIPPSVTSIGSGAFSNNRLTSVTIPASVTSIGLGTFAGNYLSSVTIPGSVTYIGNAAFAENRLTSVTIPANVTRIGSVAFAENRLTSISIPASVTFIGNMAFRANPLTRVTIPFATLTEADEAWREGWRYGIPDDVDWGFDQDVDQPEDFRWEVSGDSVIITGHVGAGTDIQIPSHIQGLPVTGIGRLAFDNRGLTSVTLPDSITTIRERAFSFNQLASVTIPDSVTRIEQDAFFRNHLTSVTIGNSVTFIGLGAFQANRLTNITIPNSVTHIDEAAFMQNRLTSVTIPDSVTYIGTGAFGFNQDLMGINVSSGNLNYSSVNGVLYNHVGTILLQWPTGQPETVVTIPNTVTTIGDWAFASSRLTSVTIGNSVTTIGEWAFYGSRLTSVTIGSSVTTIGEWAFYNNPLTSVTIPFASLTEADAAWGDVWNGWRIGIPDNAFRFTPNLPPDNGIVNVYHFNDPCDCCPGLRIRGGNQIIYNLCVNRYYMVLRTREDGSARTFFVNRDGILVDNLAEIGRVEGRIIHGWIDTVTGDLIGLSNEGSGYIYYVRHAVPVRGSMRFHYPFSENFHVDGEIHIAADPHLHAWTTIDLFPALDLLQHDYDMAYFPLPGNAAFSVNMANVQISPVTSRLDLWANQTHGGPSHAIDYLFARADGSDFRVLRIIPSYRLDFCPNGGVGAIEARIVPRNTAITLPHSNGFIRGNYAFIGWSRTSGSMVVDHAPGASFNVSGNTTLYAVWQRLMGDLRINLYSGELARTILPTVPPLEALHFSVEITAAGDGTNRPLTPVDNISNPIRVETGTYTVRVHAFADTARTLLVAQGETTNVTVTVAGGTANVSLSLIFIDPLAYGTFAWNITLPAAADTVTMRLEPLLDQNPPGGMLAGYIDLMAAPVNLNGAPLQAGFYRMTITATLAGHRDRRVTEILHIAGNLTSTAEIVIQNLINISFTVTFVNYDGHGSVMTLPYTHGQRLTDNPGFLTLHPPSYTGFVGWFLQPVPCDTDLFSAWDVSTGRVLRDVTLYAVWQRSMGYLQIRLLEQLRTILPDLPRLYFSVELTGTSGGTSMPLTPVASIDDPIRVETGTYTVSIFGFVDPARTLLAARGEAHNVTVTPAGGTAYVQVSAIFDDPLASGTFAWNITLPAVVDTVTMRLEPLFGQNPPGGVLAGYINVRATPNHSGASLQAGFYRMTITATLAGHVDRRIVNIVHIAENLTSTAEVVIPSLIPIPIWAVTFVNYDGLGSIMTLTYTHGGLLTDNNGFRTNLHPPSHYASAGFVGWFSQHAPCRTGSSNAWDFATGRVIRDLMLYACWGGCP